MSMNRLVHRIKGAQAAGEALGFPDPTLRTTRPGMPKGFAGVGHRSADAARTAATHNSF